MNTIIDKEKFMNHINDVGYTCVKQDVLSNKYDVMWKLMQSEINNRKAAKLLNLTISHIKKLKRTVKCEGYIGLIHKMKGKSRNFKFDLETKELIVSLFNGAYAITVNNKKYDFTNTTYSYLHKHLNKNGGDLKEFGIKISYSQIRNILIANGLISIRSKKYNKTHNMAGRLRNVDYLPGERLELDGTFFDFFDNGKKLCAHVVYDRGLKAPIAIYVSKGETTYGYMRAFKDVVVNYGVPKAIISDKRGTFYNLKTKEKKDKYKTRFNEMLDVMNIKYKYSSNANAKPGVERFNGEFKTNIVSDIKRHGIKTLKEFNDYLKNYVKFVQKENLKDTCGVYGKTYKVENYEKIAILKKQKYTIQHKGRIRKDGVEYELLKDGELRQFPKGTKVDYIQSLAGDYFEYNNVKYEHKISIEVEEVKYERIKVVEKECKIKDDGSILFNKEKFVIVQNNQRHLEVESGVCVKVQRKSNKFICHYDENTYKVIKLEEYKYKEEIRPKKECSVKFKCLVLYDGEESILVDQNSKIIYQDEKKLLIKYHIDGIYAFKGLKKVAKLIPKNRCSSYIPRSYLESERLSAKVVL